MNDATTIRKHSVLIAGHATSVSIEDVFWQELTLIAESRGQSLNTLVSEVDETRTGNLSSALRVFVLQNIKNHNATS